MAKVKSHHTPTAVATRYVANRNKWTAARYSLGQDDRDESGAAPQEVRVEGS
jgi:hypothetical protein